MGFGDDLLGSGMARGLAAQGKAAAFGDGKRIIWSPWSKEIFKYNPNIALPGHEGRPGLVWIPHYKGHRLYNEPGDRGWVWKMDFRPVPGQLFFDSPEIGKAKTEVPIGGFVLIEPNVPERKSVASNKQWPVERFQEIADRLGKAGHQVVQLYYGGRYRLGGVAEIETRSFREAAAVLSLASLYVGPEGGMHHAAAALGVRAVVIFGGFIPTTVTGYDGHVNLGGPPETACGSTSPCEHCRRELDAITVDAVLLASQFLLDLPAGVELKHIDGREIAEAIEDVS